MMLPIRSSSLKSIHVTRLSRHSGHQSEEALPIQSSSSKIIHVTRLSRHSGHQPEEAPPIRSSSLQPINVTRLSRRSGNRSQTVLPGRKWSPKGVRVMKLSRRSENRSPPMLSIQSSSLQDFYGMQVFHRFGDRLLETPESFSLATGTPFITGLHETISPIDNKKVT
ncbi:unnamed protein product [Rotaria socialis]|uniref:Uncharacterized protein n=1 Tax=Rotaria socialis TaxID=392032 RepID=A0A818FKE2_9BILA|nr:unnamed protein product [Rotaria socialis]CAF3530899.1 unnamed protein product [Rotaria socialis]CAF4442359.1 unnamed protein product [Rotaria socialis]CAF4484985.1 unnamed protein product [Rotaria socialis]CAF4677969.1 unnamed protein product [Rotaria socialis]